MALGEGQTNTEAFGEVVDLGEHLEEAADVFLGDARAGVLDHETYAAVNPADVQRDVLAVGVFGGIEKQFADAALKVETAGEDMVVVGQFGEEPDCQTGILRRSLIDTQTTHLVATYHLVAVGIEFLGGSAGGAVEKHVDHPAE